MPPALFILFLQDCFGSFRSLVPCRDLNFINRSHINLRMNFSISAKNVIGILIDYCNKSVDCSG